MVASLRRYLTIIQDARGYPADVDILEPTPPDGPAPPALVQVVKAEEHDALVKLLRAEIDDFEAQVDQYRHELGET